MVLEYAEGSKLYVPLSQSYLVSRYIGAHEERPVLSKLGSPKWQQTKALAQQKIIGYAAELLELYAQRSLEKTAVLGEDSEELQLFEQEFPYTETVDQLLAVQAIKEDLKAKKPMERLLSGDVGYGKTEVAMRAAFKMAFEGKKQVALLVPTTLLALQHFETFQERFQGYPLKIGLLSRFQTPKQNLKTLQELKTGDLKIIIGTHRLLSQDVVFHDLGLLIIDEEHRFGVRAKEKLKKLRQNQKIDALSMSATPIPRTLYMSLINIRDISQINTPPQDRLPIQTILTESSEELIREAISLETARQGQLFILHNRVETIFQRKAFLEKIAPQARLFVVHGQMSALEIENIFHAFKNYAADILLTTTIIESGIDIPNANTILIENADTFGLADLYQLRGRVGRWNRRAFAYLLVPKGRKLSDLARRRLAALAEAPLFGGGAKIAMRDLEIRGAGDLLGAKQSGQLAQVGFHLYCKLLKKAIEALKAKKPFSFLEPKMEFSQKALLPESYIREKEIRMEIYHRLGEASSASELDLLFQELCDRFGKPPEETAWLFSFTRLKLAATESSIFHLKFGERTLFLEKQAGDKKFSQVFVLPSEVQKKPALLERFVLDLFQKIN
jgi:transcription-repair coupling factor (superfamily II helicase)